ASLSKEKREDAEHEQRELDPVEQTSADYRVTLDEGIVESAFARRKKKIEREIFRVVLDHVGETVKRDEAARNRVLLRESIAEIGIGECLDENRRIGGDREDHGRDKRADGIALEPDEDDFRC